MGLGSRAHKNRPAGLRGLHRVVASVARRAHVAGQSARTKSGDRAVRNPQDIAPND